MRIGRLAILGLVVLRLTAAAEEPASQGALPTIPLPDIAGRTEDARALLRVIGRDLADDATLDRTEARLPSLRRRVRARIEQAEQIIQTDPSLPAMNQLTDPLSALLAELATSRRVVRDRAARLEEDVGQLDALRATWSAVETQIRDAGAPDEMQARIAALLREIADLRRRIDDRRSHLLVLLDTISNERERIEAARRRIAQLRLRSMGEILVQDRPPLLAGDTHWATMLDDLARSLRTERTIFREYVVANADRLLLDLVMIVGLGLLLARTKRRLLQRDDRDPRLDQVARILALPFSAAIIVTFLLTQWAWPVESRLVTLAATFITIIPILRVLGRLIEPAFLPFVWGVGVFSILDKVRELLAIAPGLEHLVLLAEMAALGVFLGVQQHRLQSVIADGRRRRVVLGACHTLLAVVAVALVAGGAGYLRLARLIDTVLLGYAYIALVLFAIVHVLAAVAAFALGGWPLAMLRVVQNHRWEIHRVVVRILALLAVLGWAVVALRSVGLLDPAREALATLLAAGVTHGDVSITIADVLFLAGAIWAAILAARAVRAFLEEDVFPRSALPRGVPAALGSFVYVVLVTLGVVLALTTVGIDLSKLAIFAGALGVGVGIGLQNVVNNFVSGLILLFERPIRVGDYVRLAGMDGEMRRIGVRSSSMKTFDGAEVIVPNATIISNEVTNWTLSDPTRRIDLAVGVAYGTKPTEVLALLQRVAATTPGVLPNPPPAALFLGFGDSALNFELRAWTDRVDRLGMVRSDLAIALDAALREAGIEVPFPQRDVRIRT